MQNTSRVANAVEPPPPSERLAASGDAASADAAGRAADRDAQNQRDWDAQVDLLSAA